MDKRPNRLIYEKSPYLLQHAHNPVDWFPWCNDAFEKASEKNKPIFLSIGYSTCHWCHVMETESFESEEVAALMNNTFISIKVDREERPDLDHIYMTACQMLTGSGGWPLSIIMTPEKIPFFAGTYIPKTSRFGRTGMIELIPQIEDLWRTRKDEVVNSTKKVMEALRGMDESLPGGNMDVSFLDKAFKELFERYDREHGGFGNAPKFPTPHNFYFLLRYWNRTGDKRTLEMVENSLNKMRQGGIYDHIGFGFHRYSTDRGWLVPHFEKMLYDQALLAMAYLETFQATGKIEYSDTAEEIFLYVLRDMTSPEGGFYSAEDADSEGEEGKFYVWTEEEIRNILNKNEADLICGIFNVSINGNFMEESSGKQTGFNIFHLKTSITQAAGNLKISVKELKEKISQSLKKLFKYREGRVHPHKDDKILSDWNGLMIAALAKGAQIIGNDYYRDAAINALSFILNHMVDSKDLLLHRYRYGDAGITANLDDYAFMVWGLIELFEATFDSNHLKTALRLNQDMIKYYWDDKRGGFFFTPHGRKDLIIRKKEIYDGAVPSGNSIAIMNMLRLARFTGRYELEEKAAMTVRAFSEQIKQMPSAYTQFMSAVDFSLGPSHEVVIAGKSGNHDTQKMLKTLYQNFLPNKIVIFRPSEIEAPEIDNISEFIKGHVSIDGKATAYVCRNNSCKTPVTSPYEMLEILK